MLQVVPFKLHRNVKVISTYQTQNPTYPKRKMFFTIMWTICKCILAVNDVQFSKLSVDRCFVLHAVYMLVSVTKAFICVQNLLNIIAWSNLGYIVVQTCIVQLLTDNSRL